MRQTDGPTKRAKFVSGTSEWQSATWHWCVGLSSAQLLLRYVLIGHCLQRVRTNHRQTMWVIKTHPHNSKSTGKQCIAVSNNLCLTATGNSHTIWDHTVLAASRQRWESRLYPQPKQVPDLAAPEGCKAELTYGTWKRTGRELNPQPVNRMSNALPQRGHATLAAPSHCTDSEWHSLARWRHHAWSWAVTGAKCLRGCKNFWHYQLRFNGHFPSKPGFQFNFAKKKR